MKSNTATEHLIRDLESSVLYEDPEGALAKCNRAGVYGYNAWLAWKAAEVSVRMSQKEFVSVDDVPSTSR